MFSKLVRIGKDAELKYTTSGTAILEINAVYDIGFGDKKESQWIRLSMFGQRAEKLVSHFTKGAQIVIHADEIKARPYMNNSQQAACSLEGKLIEFQFAGSGQKQAPQQRQQPMQPQQAPQQQNNFAPQQQAPQQSQTQYNEPPMDFDDDIPFAPIGLQFGKKSLHAM